MSDFKKIHHIGIAVENLEESIQLYTTLTGSKPSRIEEVSTEKVKTAFFETGESHLELLQATSEDSAIAQFIAKKGKGGIHHICVQVDDLQKKLDELKAAGFQLINDKPVPGAHGMKVAFVHPKSTGGVLLELAEPIQN